MKLFRSSNLFFLAAMLSFSTLTIFGQELAFQETNLPEKEESVPVKTNYDKSILVDAVFYDDVRFYTIRYNMELLKGKNISFNGSIGLGLIDPDTKSAIFNESSVNSNEIDIVVPLEANLVIGQKQHKLELGLGANLLFGLEKTEEALTREGTSGIQISQYQAEQEVTSLWVFSHIAYRYQPKVDGKLFLRAGIMPTIKPYTLNEEVDFNVGLNVGLGYTF
ncbi:MAG: hypothetical protein AB8B69_07075 [Chitinophagales bacterium]